MKESLSYPYHVRCAWFDERDDFEFYPLHLVHRKR